MNLPFISALTNLEAKESLKCWFQGSYAVSEHTLIVPVQASGQATMWGWEEKGKGIR